MRIGLIGGPWIPVPPPAYGGTERVVDTLARGLAAAGHEVVLAVPSDSTCPLPRVPGMRASDPAEPGGAVSELSQVIRAYRALADMDLIHDHTVSGPLYMHRPTSVPVVTTIHGALTPSAADVYCAIGRNASIIAISHNQVRHAPQVPVARVIHHGLDLSTVPQGSGRGGYACFVGRMCPDKGVMEAIAVARKAGIPLRIAAKMRALEEVRYYREVVAPQLGPNEEFMGEIGDADKYALMGEAVAFLNPIQWSEPFGLVMIESLATGTPVVGTPVGSAPEIVEHGSTGYLAPVEELPGLVTRAAGLSRVACRASVQERFSAERMVADHLDLFAHVLQQQVPVPFPGPQMAEPMNRMQDLQAPAGISTGTPASVQGKGSAR